MAVAPGPGMRAVPLDAQLVDSWTLVNDLQHISSDNESVAMLGGMSLVRKLRHDRATCTEIVAMRGGAAALVKALRTLERNEGEKQQEFSSYCGVDFRSCNPCELPVRPFHGIHRCRRTEPGRGLCSSRDLLPPAAHRDGVRA